jgi:hypothetical protein
MDLHDKLPAGNYIIKADPFGNLFLEQIDSFTRPVKLYGDTIRHTDRILNTFMSRDASTGVMLAGEKGSGKSLLAKNLSIEAVKQSIPTIVINAPWKGDAFNKFMQDIEQPIIVLFDEFEKVYDQDDQESILTLLDGVFPSKKLFILTCNDKWRVNQHMRNRPGRLFYMLDFKGLGYEFIREYCQDNLNDQSHVEKVCQISSLFGEFNFDMLKAMVEEMNRYNETPQEALRMLNAKPEFEENHRFNIRLFVGEQELEEKNFDGPEWRGNPLQQTIGIDYDPEPDNDEADWTRARFQQNDLQQVDAPNGRFVFMNVQGHKLLLTRIKEKTPNYFDAF